jgi:hypothetical protein
MSSTDQIKMWFSSFAMQFPVMLVSLVAIVIILAKWRQAGGGAIWALLGFGVALILCIVVPLVQTIVQSWVIQNGDMAHRVSVLSNLAILWSVLRAVSYALLLVAIIGGRPAPQPVAPR